MTLRAGVLVRISDDRSGDALGVERQERDCRALATRRGWSVAKVYRENDTSAFKRRKVTLPDGSTALRVLRPAFRELLDDLTTGTVDAVVAYDLDRVARDPRDLEDLIDAVEVAHAPTAVVTGEIDLSTDGGVFMARMLVNVANKSSRDTSRRVRRAMEAVAEAGGEHGGRPAFGYRRGGTDPLEATVVRWLHEQVQAGRSLRGLAVEVAGYFPGRRWDAEAVGRIVTSPRYAGLRVHRGAVVGPASWPAIVDVDTLERTQAVLADREHPARHAGGPRRYLLTGLLVCGRCGGTLYPRRNADRQRFGCLPTRSGGCGGSIVVYDPAQAFVERVALAKLAEVEPVEDVPDDPSADLRRRIAGWEQEQADLGRALADDPSAVLMLRAANRALAEKIDAARAELRAAQRTRRVADPLRVVEQWPALDVAQRRAYLDILLDRVEVGPGTGGPRFDPDRLTFVWR